MQKLKQVKDWRCHDGSNDRSSKGWEMSNQYRIETLGDFLKIPADRIEECMKELACHLTAMRMTIEKKHLKNISKSSKTNLAINSFIFNL